MLLLQLSLLCPEEEEPSQSQLQPEGQPPSPWSAADLFERASKNCQTIDNESWLQLIKCDTSAFVDLLGGVQDVSLAEPVVMVKLLKEILKVPHVWISHGMTEQYRMKFSRIVSKNKVCTRAGKGFWANFL